VVESYSTQASTMMKSAYRHRITNSLTLAPLAGDPIPKYVVSLLFLPLFK